MDEGSSRKRKLPRSSQSSEYDLSQEPSPSPDPGGTSTKRLCLDADALSDRPLAKISLPQHKSHMAGAAIILPPEGKWDGLSSMERADAETMCQAMLVQARHVDPTFTDIVYSSLHGLLRALGLHYTANNADAALVGAKYPDIFKLYHSFQGELVATNFESSRELARYHYELVHHGKSFFLAFHCYVR